MLNQYGSKLAYSQNGEVLSVEDVVTYVDDGSKWVVVGIAELAKWVRVSATSLPGNRHRFFWPEALTIDKFLTAARKAQSNA